MFVVSFETLARRHPLGAANRCVLVTEILLLRVSASRCFRRGHNVRAAVETLRLRLVQPPPPVPADRAFVAERLSWMTRKVLRPLPGDQRCLMQSLVLTGLLSRRGLPSRVVIGVNKDEALQAHAWVTVDGHPVSDPGKHEQLAVL